MTAFLANLYLRAIALRDREEGQTMAEYGIILVLIAVAALVGVTALGVNINGVFNDLTTRF